ncbi:hypothetical protein PR048_027216 [Dryococelus australis]|uniref:Uncharacterized protein n=1 Tax=Dryococelus australis TaxID=614101 RepID=A0ABQ9GEU0_9NEOP|nr:hypothetical protein PR048_027216 [Dryococelus australis]
MPLVGGFSRGLSLFPSSQSPSSALKTSMLGAVENLFTHEPEGPGVAERLDCSPPTKVNRAQSSAGFSPGFSQLGIVPDDAAGRQVFLGDLPFPPPFHSPVPFSPRVTLIGSQDLPLHAAEISSLTSAYPFADWLSGVLGTGLVSEQAAVCSERFPCWLDCRLASMLSCAALIGERRGTDLQPSVSLLPAVAPVPGQEYSSPWALAKRGRLSSTLARNNQPCYLHPSTTLSPSLSVVLGMSSRRPPVVQYVGASPVFGAGRFWVRIPGITPRYVVSTNHEHPSINQLAKNCCMLTAGGRHRPGFESRGFNEFFVLCSRERVKRRRMAPGILILRMGGSVGCI